LKYYVIYTLFNSNCKLILPSSHQSNQIKSKLFCHKFSTGTQYNNEFALRLAGQTSDNFALMFAHVCLSTIALKHYGTRLLLPNFYY